MSGRSSRPSSAPVERGFYRLAGIDPRRSRAGSPTRWPCSPSTPRASSCSMRLMRLQAVLPLNPQGFDPVAPDLAFNTAVSFVTNTNWQSYGGETTMSHLGQMVGLTVQNFLSAATGIALAIALMRAFARSGAATVGNFWVDLTRATLYVLLPLSIAARARLRRSPACRRRCWARSTRRRSKAPSRPSRSVRSPARRRSSSSAPMAAASSTSMPRIRSRTRTLSQHSLDLVDAGDLGGAALHLRPDGRRPRQGWALLAAMLAILIAGVGVVYWAEADGNPILARARRRSRRRQHGRQGSPLRPGHVRALCGGDDRPVRRRRQCHARLVHAAWRPRAACS